MNKLSLIKKFLSYFWQPALRLITEAKWRKKIATNKNYWLENFLKMNEDEKYKAGLFFTPNGCYWKDVEVGEDYDIKKDKAKCGFHCLRVDIDTWISQSELEERIKATGSVPTFIVKTWRWWHLYFMFDFELKDEKIWRKLEDKLNSLFNGDKSNIHIAKLLRVPYSYYWKSGKKLVELYYYDTNDEKLKKIEKEKDFENIDDVLFRSESAVYQSYKMLEEEEKAIKEVEKNVRKDTRILNKIDEINKLKIWDVINKLYQWKYFHEYKWKKYLFKLWKRIGSSADVIEIVDEDGTIYTPDGYRLNFHENYVNNFSDTYHPIEERPRWPVVAFLYYYFNKNWNKVFDFLKKEFWIEVEWYWGDWLKYESTSSDDMLIFKDDGIYLFTTKPDGSVVEQKLFTGRWIINEYTEIYEKKMWAIIGWDKIRYYVAKKLDESGNIVKEVLFKYEATATDFNKKYGKFEFRILKPAFLNHFFNILDENLDKFSKIEVIQESGIYKDLGIVAVPNEVIYEQNRQDVVIKIDILEDDIKEYKWGLNQTQVSIEEAFEQYQKLWTEEVAVTSFLQFLVLTWLNFWDNNEFIKIKSGLGIFNKSSAWKTTMVQILKSLMWRPLRWRMTTARTTPQSMKEFLSDPSVAVIEEYGADMNPLVEDVIKDALNMFSSWRWFANENIKWKLNANLILLWQYTPKDEAVQNRLVTIYLTHADKKWTPELLNSIMKLNIKDDVYQRYFNFEIEGDILEIYDEVKKVFKWTLINEDRLAETSVRAVYLGIKWLNWDFNYIVDKFRKIFSRVYVQDKQTEGSERVLSIKDYLYWLLMKKKAIMNAVQYRNWVLYEIWLEGNEARKESYKLLDLKEAGFNIYIGNNIGLTYFVPDENRTTEQAAIGIIFDDLKQVVNYKTIFKEEEDYLNL